MIEDNGRAADRSKTGTANDNTAAEAKVNAAVLAIARLIGRQIAREQFERAHSPHNKNLGAARHEELQGETEKSMTSFVFEVKERTIAPGEHSWVAIETASDTEVALPHGGNTMAGKNLVGCYPEIEEFLRQAHGLTVRLVYSDTLDQLIRHADGKSTWVFHRQNHEVIVHDIPRAAASITLAGTGGPPA